MIDQLEELIGAEDFDSAVKVIPTLKDLFHEVNEITRTLDDLKYMLDEHDPDCQRKLDDIKILVVG
ncbi:MAG: hypothetical protein ACI843_000470 [Psychrobacter glaciei]|jgi:hypothetical protein